MEAVAVTNTIPQAENMKKCSKIKVSLEHNRTHPDTIDKFDTIDTS